MRINHNLSALNTYSRLSQATTAQSKSLEKLSSGQRINRAGDDAAGLAISEKMRSQIRGLDQASRNSQDGISMIQTAEGALSETHSILQRMRELAVQAGNDTNTAQDRGEVQNEINQLTSEINRIAGTTEFNKQKILNGGLSETAVGGAKVELNKIGTNQVKAVFEVDLENFGAACLINIDINGTATDVGICAAICGNGCTVAGRVAMLAASINNCAVGACFTATSVGSKLILTSNRAKTADPSTLNGCSIVSLCATTKIKYTEKQTVQGACAIAAKVYVSATDDLLKQGTLIDIGRNKFALWDSSSGCYESASDFRLKNNLSTCVKLYDVHCTAFDTAKEVLTSIAACTEAGNYTFTYNSTDARLEVASTCAGVTTNNDTEVKIYGIANTAATSDNGTKLQIGANADQTFTLNFGNMYADAIGVSGNVAGKEIDTSDGKKASLTSSMVVTKDGVSTQFALDVSSADKATAAISALDDAIGKVSSERSKLGAYQNRLEHTIANLGTASENLTAAESRIRDVDMAKEMMEFTKNNILNQAATAMLAQANQQPQGVLQLLR